MKQNVSKSLEVARLDLLRRASTYGDLEAWAVFQQSLEETILSWFHDHPGSQVASRLHSEWYFVALAFERLRLAVLQGQVTCETLFEVVLYLRASLNGAILETLRISERPEAVSSPWADEGDCPDRNEVWERLQTRLSNQREQRLAFLLYHCGLSPTEIVRYCPQEWGNVQEVIHLRRIILARFMQRPSYQVP